MKFSRKKFKNWRSWKKCFFKSAILNFFFQEKKIFLLNFFEKHVKVYWLARICRNFDDYPGLLPKMSHTKHFYRQCTFIDRGSTKMWKD